MELAAKRAKLRPSLYFSYLKLWQFLRIASFQTPSSQSQSKIENRSLSLPLQLTKIDSPTIPWGFPTSSSPYHPRDLCSKNRAFSLFWTLFFTIKLFSLFLGELSRDFCIEKIMTWEVFKMISQNRNWMYQMYEFY